MGELGVSIRRLVLMLLCVTGVAMSPTNSRADEVRERLNRIFYWHLSDDLKLSPQQEKSMIQIIEDIQTRRQSALSDRDKALEALKKLGKSPTASDSEKVLSRYRKTLEVVGALDVEEADRLKKLLGPATLVRFYVVREEVLGRVKEALQNVKDKK
jgi:hypothetical protein